MDAIIEKSENTSDFPFEWKQWAFAQTNPGKEMSDRISDTKLLLGFMIGDTPQESPSTKE